MILLKSVSFGFSSKMVLSDITLALGKTPFEVIVGPSGSGKTTLLRLIAGVLAVEKGTIHIAGKPVFGPKNQLIAGHPGVAWVPQDFQLAPYVTLADHIRRNLWHLPSQEQYEELQYWLYLFDLTAVADQKTHLISGGQMQRAAIAAALAKRPAYLLLDEPFNQLDPQRKQELITYLQKVSRETDTKMLIVSHEAASLLPYAHRFLFLENGRIAQDGDGPTVFFNPHSAQIANLLGIANFLSKSVPISEIASAHIIDEQFVVRPNQLKIHPGGPWEVKEVAFYGTHRLVRLKNSFHEVWVQVPITMNVCEGDHFSIQFVGYKPL